LLELFDEAKRDGWIVISMKNDWKNPYGPGSSIKGLDDHPVVQLGKTYAEFGSYTSQP